jgi:hypothetical protein
MPKNKLKKCRKALNNIFHPARIILMRHAEKPDDKSIITLSDKGYSRASALPPEFIAAFGKPYRIYAAANDKKSIRPYETALPLAESINMEVLAPYVDDDYLNLVNDILSDPELVGRTIVIFWHHGNMANIVEKLGGPVVKKWDKNIYDRLWILDYTADSIVYQDSAQRLLFGDSKK